MKQFLVYLSILFILNACQQGLGGENSRKGDFLLAEVQESKLYFSDIPKIQFSTQSAEDSLIILKRIVDEWINEEIFSLKAKETISNLNLITFEVENYKRALISAAYEKELLEDFELELSESELVEYYKQNIEFFVFEEAYYDISYILLPRVTKNLAKIKKAITDGSENHWLDNYCVQEPEKCVINSSTIAKEVFLQENLKLPNYKLKRSLIYNYQYISNELVMIYRINKKYNVGDIAPVEMVKKELTNLARYKKKQAYLLEIKEKTIQNAKNDKIFEKYIN